MYILLNFQKYYELLRLAVRPPIDMHPGCDHHIFLTPSLRHQTHALELIRCPAGICHTSTQIADTQGPVFQVLFTVWRDIFKKSSATFFFFLFLKNIFYVVWRIFFLFLLPILCFCVQIFKKKCFFFLFFFF